MLDIDGVDLAFNHIPAHAPAFKRLETVCAHPYLRLSNSAFARSPKAFHAIANGYALDERTDDDPYDSMSVQSKIRRWLQNTFLGWHCTYEEEDGLAHTVVALAPKTQELTGKKIEEHIARVGGCHLVENAPAASRELEKALEAKPPDPKELDHAYRLFLTIMFNNGKGTLIRGESPIVLVNPVVVHVHGTYLTSMATECAVRGYVEPSPSFLLRVGLQHQPAKRGWRCQPAQGVRELYGTYPQTYSVHPERLCRSP